MKKLAVIVLALLALSACSGYSSNGEDLYLKSRNGVKPEVSPPLTTSNINHGYDLPPQNQNAQVNIAPPRGIITETQ